MALLLDMSPRFLERVLYFSHWIVTKADQNKIATNVEKILTPCRKLKSKR